MLGIWYKNIWWRGGVDGLLMNYGSKLPLCIFRPPHTVQYLHPLPTNWGSEINSTKMLAFCILTDTHFMVIMLMKVFDQQFHYILLENNLPNFNQNDLNVDQIDIMSVCCSKFGLIHSLVSYPAFLVIGSCEGLITVWSVTAVGGSVAVSKMLDVWSERDRVPVQAVTWVHNLCVSLSLVELPAYITSECLFCRKSLYSGTSL